MNDSDLKEQLEQIDGVVRVEVKDRASATEFRLKKSVNVSKEELAKNVGETNLGLYNKGWDRHHDLRSDLSPPEEWYILWTKE